MNRETFEIVWPFIEEMNRKTMVGTNAHYALHNLNIQFVPWSMLSEPHTPIAKILLKELDLLEEKFLNSMSEQVWDATAGILDKEEYYKAICDLTKQWME